MKKFTKQKKTLINKICNTCKGALIIDRRKDLHPKTITELRSFLEYVRSFVQYK